uniref:BZIP domain-containing protein n=1 Tax=Kalanchoe fedtschenkoi TaxID=63787 RepID=A0A7N0SY05_KALFE
MAQLPPKVPPHMTQNWPSFPHHHHHHTLFPPPLPPPNPQSSWMDQFLDCSPNHRHRRSISDSITTFLGEERKQHEKKDDRGHHDFDGLNEEQLMSMFSDNVVTLGDTSSVVSDPNSDNGDCETGSSQKDVEMYMSSNGTGELGGASGGGSGDTITDPKRVKRILANRQSAQRSRVKKLQYISELEQSVTLLQTEVSALSPRVAFLDHQRLILSMDNSTLKQKIAALAQDSLFKDAHEDALKKEIERLRQVYQHQQKSNKNASQRES